MVQSPPPIQTDYDDQVVDHIGTVMRESLDLPNNSDGHIDWKGTSRKFLDQLGEKGFILVDQTQEYSR